MRTNYPKARRINIGYALKADRLYLLTHLEQKGSRRALIPRRILIKILKRMGKKLTSSHPATEETSSPDAVLQMEHMMSVVGG